MKEKKNRLRKEITHQLMAMSPDEKKREEQELTALILKSTSWVEAEVILAYLPMREEFNTLPLLQIALDQGKKIALPRLKKQNRAMEFHLMESLEGPFKRHSFGMDEPLKSSPIWLPGKKEQTLLLLPGLAFDRAGRRLGRGGGYYDTFLMKNAKDVTILAAPFRCQIVEEIPVEIHDYAVEHLILLP